MDISAVVSIVGALGIGSFVGQYLSGAQQRRAVRSAVLARLAEVEAARWAREEPHDPPFLQAMHGLETAALIARLPRKSVSTYRLIATAAWWTSLESFEHDMDPEYGGGISADLADITRNAASELSRLAWSPVGARVFQRGRLDKLKAEMLKIENDDARRQVQRAIRFYG